MTEPGSRAAQVPTRVLSFHAPYACRERGACCTAGWPIPIEATALHLARSAMAAGRLRPVVAIEEPLPFMPDAPADTPAIVAHAANRCVFHHDEGTCRCGLQRSIGEAALPHACRQFPRIVVHEPRGHSITLSAFCPTVVDLLHTDLAPAIVVDAAGFEAATLSGLDVREALPPALRPDMLMSWPAWERFEARAVACIWQADSAAEGMARLSWVVETVRRWRPADGELTGWIDEAFAAGDRAAGSGTVDAELLPDVAAVAVELTRAVPAQYQTRAAAALSRRGRPPRSDVHRRMLAAHAFGSWTAHLGEGLRTWLRSIEAVHVLLAAGVDVRDVDLVVRHLADPAALARGWRGVESAIRARRPSRTAGGSRRARGW